MTREPPSLRQQIEAVERAADIVAAKRMTEAGRMMADEIDELLRRLEGAVEQLKTWEFAQEVLN
jgi:chromosomal replication initiation ATPase DnaA